MSTSYLQNRPEHTQPIEESSREREKSPVDTPARLPLIPRIFSTLVQLPLRFFHRDLAHRSEKRTKFNTSLQQTSYFQQGKQATEPSHETSRPMILTFHFADHAVRKELDCAIFSRWDSISTVVSALEEDGVIVVYLWDRVEDMAIRSGDWDARVRPGWEVDVICSDGEHYDDTNWIYDDDEPGTRDSSDLQDCEDDELSGKQWWFERWRTRVEQEVPWERKAVLEPSWSALMLGGSSILLFLGGVVMYCLV